MVVAVAVGLFVMYQMRDRGPIRFENFEQIQDGMTLAEVEQLLGCKAGDHSTDPVEFRGTLHDGSIMYMQMGFDRLSNPANANHEGTMYTWYGDHGVIHLFFDEKGMVAHKGYSPGRPPRPAWWSALERSLGLGR